MFLQKGGISRRGMKYKRRGADTPFCTALVRRSPNVSLLPVSRGVYRTLPDIYDVDLSNAVQLRIRPGFTNPTKVPWGVARVPQA